MNLVKIFHIICIFCGLSAYFTHAIQDKPRSRIVEEFSYKILKDVCYYKGYELGKFLYYVQAFEDQWRATIYYRANKKKNLQWILVKKYYYLLSEIPHDSRHCWIKKKIEMNNVDCLNILYRTRYDENDVPMEGLTVLETTIAKKVMKEKSEQHFYTIIDRNSSQARCSPIKEKMIAIRNFTYRLKTRDHATAHVEILYKGMSCSKSRISLALIERYSRNTISNDGTIKRDRNLFHSATVINDEELVAQYIPSQEGCLQVTVYESVKPAHRVYLL